MRVREVVDVLEAIAPTLFAESWDNVGLLIGDAQSEIARLLLTIDCTHEVLEEAHAQGAGMVVAYHPPIFQALKRLPSSSLVYKAIRHGIAVYSPHTALDVAAGGTNDVLGDAVGLLERAPLRPLAKKDVEYIGEVGAIGMGRVGAIAPAPREDVIARIKEKLGLDRVLVAGPVQGPVERVAVCAGACGDLYRDAIAARADLYLTGELRHHDALAAAAAGMTVVCVLHSNSERIALDVLERTVRARIGQGRLEVARSVLDRDPFTIL